MGFMDWLKGVGSKVSKVISGLANSKLVKNVLGWAKNIPVVGTFANWAEKALTWGSTITDRKDVQEFLAEPPANSSGPNGNRNMQEAIAYGGSRGNSSGPNGNRNIGIPPSLQPYQPSPLQRLGFGGKRSFESMGGVMNPYPNMGGRADRMLGNPNDGLMMSAPKRLPAANAHIGVNSWQDRANMAAFQEAQASQGFATYERAKNFGALQGQGARVNQIAALNGAFSPQTGALRNGHLAPDNSQAAYVGNVFGGGNGTYGGGSPRTRTSGLRDVWTQQDQQNYDYMPPPYEAQAFVNDARHMVSF